MLEVYPFLLLILAGLAAAISAVLLRRASPALGSWLLDLSTVVDVVAAAAMVWALVWAWGIEFPPQVQPRALLLAGWGLALAGGALAGWGTRRRGLGPLRRWSSERFETSPPYRLIRRPIFLGLTALSAGLALLRGTTALGVWLAGVVVAWSLALELGDWELRRRLPASRDYLRRTPRVFPRWRSWRKE